MAESQERRWTIGRLRHDSHGASEGPPHPLTTWVVGPATKPVTVVEAERLERAEVDNRELRALLQEAAESRHVQSASRAHRRTSFADCQATICVEARAALSQHDDPDPRHFSPEGQYRPPSDDPEGTDGA